jgi:V/A-type H+-transporting ATPase subunit D
MEKVSTIERKVAGLKVPSLEAVHFGLDPYSMVSLPFWVPAGLSALKEISTLNIRRGLAEQKARLLEAARRKTTQKVNLYEKVQIPAFREGIRRIKRFLEDEENLSKSSQKILKARLAAAEASA